jgi:hypothetical protein
MEFLRYLPAREEVTNKLVDEKNNSDPAKQASKKKKKN